MPLNKAYRMSLPLVSDSHVTLSLWPHHTEPLTKRNKQRYQNRGKNVILLKIFPHRGMTVSLSIYMSGKLSPTLDTVVLNIGLTPQPQRDANVRNRRQTESNIKLAFIHRRGATVRNRLLTTVKSRTLRDDRPSLLGLSRNIVQTRAESSLLGYAECSRYSTKVNRDRGRQSQTPPENEGAK